MENIFDELDAPGEWFLDAKTSTLYFYPHAGLDLATATFESVRLKHLLEFRGTEQSPVRFVTLSGLTFRRAARTLMENKEPCRILERGEVVNDPCRRRGLGGGRGIRRQHAPKPQRNGRKSSRND